MPSSMALRGLLLSLLLAVAASTGADPEAAKGALPSDDECGPENLEGACAVNALQRRALQRNVAEAAQDGSEERAEEDAEERAFGAEVKAASMLGVAINTSWGGCSHYGCSSGYRRGQACQCYHSCARYGNCCGDYRSKCRARSPSQPGSGNPPSRGGHSSYQGTMTLYHQTSRSACRSILRSGFRIGRGGWCGKGIYFATSPQATKGKAITPASGTGCMIEAKVKVGKVLKFPCCRYCGGRKEQHVSHNNEELKAKGYDSISINPGDGDEYIVYDPSKVISMRTVKFRRSWTAHQQHWR
uniref:SMB domain-containing protein n=1 Tax=Alexandrium catenella TaxID=2925 RepID=A0A7S1WV27_ALECA